MAKSGIVVTIAMAAGVIGLAAKAIHESADNPAVKAGTGIVVVVAAMVASAAGSAAAAEGFDGMAT